MPGSSQPVHTSGGERRQHQQCRSLPGRGPALPAGAAGSSGALRLPADPPAQLRRLALLLALLEQRLERGGQDHEGDEEHDQAERDERDDLVVGLSDDALAVVRGVSRSRQQEGQDRGRQGESHACPTIPCAPWRTIPSPASWRSPRGAATSTSGTTSGTLWCSTASSSHPWCIPTDCGFIPETLGLDGDALDVMVCVSEPTFPGCMIDVKPVALFRMEDDKGVDDKVLGVPLSDPGWNKMEKLEDLPKQLRDEIAHFFSIYTDLEQKKVTVDGWYSREDAIKEIAAAPRALQRERRPLAGH